MLALFKKIKPFATIPFIGIIILMLLPNLLIAFYYYKEMESITISFSFLLLTSILLLLQIALFKGKSFVYWGAFSFLLLPIELMALLLAKEPVSYGLILSGLNTNINEALELVSVILYLILGSSILLGIYIYLGKRYLKQPLSLNGQQRFGICVIFILFIGSIFMQMFRFTDDREPLYERLNFAHTSTMSKIYKVFPFDIIYYLTKSSIDLYHTNSLNNQIALGNFHISYSPTNDLTKSDDLPIIVYCIGETGNRKHWSLFGYHRETTPYLQQRENLLLFDNALASATTTNISIPMMISRSRPHDFNLWEKEGTLIHCFNQAKFRTAWLGNQASNFPVVSVISKQVSYYYNSKAELNTKSYDSVLFPEFQKEISEACTSNKASFIVLHTLGSHFRYDHRYPEEFEFFKPSIKDLSILESLDESNRKTLINSYDNTIRYTDYFLNELLSILDKLNRPAVLLYSPDHGEDLGEYNQDNLLHGSENPTIDELEIPVLIAYNTAFKRLNQDKLKALKNILHKPLHTAELPSLIVELSGIKSPEFKPSILDSTYRFATERYFLSTNKNLKTLSSIQPSH